MRCMHAASALKLGGGAFGGLTSVQSIPLLQENKIFVSQKRKAGLDK